MIQDKIHSQIVNHCQDVEQWFEEKSRSLYVPIYSSYDMRDSGHKVVNVDANIFPAGFNNICPIDKDTAVEKVDQYLRRHYGVRTQKILLLAEEHTNNLFYWQNVLTLSQLIELTKREIRVGILREFKEPLELSTSTGNKILVHSVSRHGGSAVVGDFIPDLIISNNDFSNPYEEWNAGLQTPMNPPRELGWYQRRKDIYFRYYNELAGEFANLIGMDPWHLQVMTRKISHFDISADGSVDQLATLVDEMVAELKVSYAKHGIQEDPFIFIKNNSGTYGLAVMQVTKGEDIRNWNYKTRKKMKAAKGGRDVDELIVQEGVSSIVTSDQETAEPVIYMIGCELAGGFLRTHSEKGPTESLNSPGAVYKKLCVSDLRVDVKGCPLENVYGCVARLGALAIGRETEHMNVSYLQYDK